MHFIKIFASHLPAMIFDLNFVLFIAVFSGLCYTRRKYLLSNVTLYGASLYNFLTGIKDEYKGALFALRFGYNYYRLKLKNFMNTTVNEKFNDKYFRLTFELDGDYYHILYEKPSSSLRAPIVDILYENESVKDRVMRYAGPARNFYGLHVTPKMLNYDGKLSVQFIDRTVEFSGDQKIVL